ncbi:hypothetical protein, partial [Escherichia coli]|uniref:hypothetical protein n=1 Tax=Escherichia coli TaxID=562 RepID=UPI00195AA642
DVKKLITNVIIITTNVKKITTVVTDHVSGLEPSGLEAAGISFDLTGTLMYYLLELPCGIW